MKKNKFRKTKIRKYRKLLYVKIDLACYNMLLHTYWHAVFEGCISCIDMNIDNYSFCLFIFSISAECE
jgi:hypothetical protein